MVAVAYVGSVYFSSITNFSAEGRYDTISVLANK